jgi:hypothetical protein
VSLPLNLQQNSNPRLSNQSRPATSAETLPLSFTAATFFFSQFSETENREEVL